MTGHILDCNLLIKTELQHIFLHWGLARIMLEGGFLGK